MNSTLLFFSSVIFNALTYSGNIFSNVSNTRNIAPNRFLLPSSQCARNVWIWSSQQYYPAITFKEICESGPPRIDSCSNVVGRVVVDLTDVPGEAFIHTREIIHAPDPFAFKDVYTRGICQNKDNELHEPVALHNLY